MSLGQAVGEGLMLGLASSAHCIGICGPALAPVVVGAREEGVSPWRVALVFQAGRVLGYLAVLAGAAALGGALADTAWSRTVAGVGLIALAAAVLAYALFANLPELRVCRSLHRWEYGRRAPWLFGLLVGLSPCPPLLLACAAVGERGGTGEAVALASGFLVATTAPTMAFALLGLEAVAGRLRELGRAAAVLAAIWFMAQGVVALRGG